MNKFWPVIFCLLLIASSCSSSKADLAKIKLGQTPELSDMLLYNPDPSEKLEAHGVQKNLANHRTTDEFSFIWGFEIPGLNFLEFDGRSNLRLQYAEGGEMGFFASIEGYTLPAAAVAEVHTLLKQLKTEELPRTLKSPPKDNPTYLSFDRPPRYHSLAKRYNEPLFTSRNAFPERFGVFYQAIIQLTVKYDLWPKRKRIRLKEHQQRSNEALRHIKEVLKLSKP